MTLLNIAQIDVEMGASKHEVQKNIDSASSRFNTMGDSRGTMYCDTIRAALDMRDGDLVVAKTLFQNCLRFAWGRTSEAVSYCLERLGDFQQWSALDETSWTWTVTFFVDALQKRQKLEIYKALQFLGDVYLAENDQHTATHSPRWMFIAAELSAKQIAHIDERLVGVSNLPGNNPRLLPNVMDLYAVGCCANRQAMEEQMDEDDLESVSGLD
ncbi:hypothetical protein FB451DRAFT_1182541 [Mycena latifolia]|nr:hypothetical protein FB451DRAFT_1182541 [Mycena latifolia]